MTITSFFQCAATRVSQYDERPLCANSATVAIQEYFYWTQPSYKGTIYVKGYKIYSDPFDVQVIVSW